MDLEYIRVRSEYDEILSQIKLVIVNPSLRLNSDNGKVKDPMSEVFSLYFTGKKTWDDFKLRVIKLLKENAEMSPYNTLEKITKAHVRLWMCPINSLKSLSSRIREDLRRLSEAKHQS